MISIVIPANNEQGYIGECLGFVLRSDPLPEDGAGQPQVIVVANGCTDGTVAEAQALVPDFERRGWRLDVLDLPDGSKVRALNAGDRATRNLCVLYMDADVHITPGLIRSVAVALDVPEPRFVSGRPRIRPARSRVSERYARFWERLPFMSEKVAGCGLYAVNAAGRARWQHYPDLIADDMYARYHFAPSDMFRVPNEFSWPITEGFRNLVRVRRRQNEGLSEIRAKLPELANGTEQTRPNPRRIMELLFRDPIGFSVYASVAAAVRTPIFRNRNRWHRGR